MKLLRRHGRHAPFYAAVIGGVCALPIASRFAPDVAVEAAANVFFLLYLGLTAFKVPRLTAAFLRQHAEGADEPVPVIFAVTFGAVVVAVGALFVLINKGVVPSGLELGLSLASVALGWMTIHTMAALHYAHLYWRPERPPGADPANDAEVRGGLDFPGQPEPTGYDFLYFAFVVGMTAQTSDVAVTTTAMRKRNLFHAVISFFFNTVLVAAAVNVAVSLGR